MSPSHLSLLSYRSISVLYTIVQRSISPSSLSSAACSASILEFFSSISLNSWMSLSSLMQRSAQNHLPTWKIPVVLTNYLSQDLCSHFNWQVMILSVSYLFKHIALQNFYIKKRELILSLSQFKKLIAKYSYILLTLSEILQTTASDLGYNL